MAKRKKGSRSAAKSGRARVAARPKGGRRTAKGKRIAKRRPKIAALCDVVAANRCEAHQSTALGKADDASKISALPSPLQAATDTSEFQAPIAPVGSDDVSSVSPLRKAMDECAARYVKPKQSSMTVQEFFRGIMPTAIGPRNAADCANRMVKDLREYSGGAPVRGLLLRAGKDSKGFYVIAASASLPDHDWTFEAVYQHRA